MSKRNDVCSASLKKQFDLFNHTLVKDLRKLSQPDVFSFDGTSVWEEANGSFPLVCLCLVAVFGLIKTFPYAMGWFDTQRIR